MRVVRRACERNARRASRDAYHAADWVRDFDLTARRAASIVSRRRWMAAAPKQHQLRVGGSNVRIEARDSHFRVRPLAAAVAATLAALAPSAHAQQAGAPAASGGGLDEIVVTARRVEERLIDVPVAVTAFTEEEMARRNILGIADIAKYTAGFSFENYSGGTTPAPTIRGLSQTVLADRNQNVATFIDGVHVQQQGNVDFSLLDVERIEVLKGPQNSQYGRSAFAGAINYVPKQPKLDAWTADVVATLGTHDRQEIRAGMGIPLWQDRLAVRLYVTSSEFDGTWANRFPTGDAAITTRDSVIGRTFKGTNGNAGGWDNQAYRAAFLFKPIDSLTIDASWFKSQVRAEYGPTQQIRPNAASVWGLTYQTNCSPNALGTFQLYCGELKVDRDKLFVDPRNVGNYADTYLTTARAKWEIADWVTATYQFGTGRYFTSQLNQSSNPPNPTREGCGPTAAPCTPATAAQGYVLFAIGSVYQQSKAHELRFDGKFGDGIDWRLGYYHNTVKDESYQNSSERRRSLLADPTGQTIVVSGALPKSNFDDENDSVFGSVSLKFGKFTTDVEARYSREDRLLVGSPIGKRRFNEFTPRVNFKYQPASTATYYASIAKGSKAGGFNTILAPPGNETFQPETNLTYELGTKQSLLDGRLQINADVFYVKWKDLQVSTANLLAPIPPATARPNFVANAAGATSKGVEIEAVWVATDFLRFNFAGSYADPKYDAGTRDAGLGGLCNSTTPVCTAVLIPRPPAAPAVVADIGGNTLARTPKVKVAGGLEFTGALNNAWTWSARTDVSHQGKIYAESLNQAWFPARTLVDLNLSLASGDRRWGLSLWGRNVTNEAYAANAFVIGFVNLYNPTLGEGRSFGVTGRFNY
jgi:iron complex outermembrane receptor protein